ncbi:MAG: twin-arginine translocase subunit TatC [Candidatus Pacebacteria bacterium]|nr:twin-arginine translocase subunit TatC [Candidatus Paceibacterota bacterium]
MSNFLSTYFDEARLFFRNFTEWFLLLLIFTIFFFLFGLKEVVFFERVFMLPLPTNPSFAADFFNQMVVDLVPHEVLLVVTGPLAAFIAQIKIALLLAFVFTLPVFLYRFVHYLSPALRGREKRTIFAVAFLSALLFALGGLFSYLVLIPPTFDILYVYTGAIDAAPFFTVNEFVGLVLSFVLATGILFLLPVVQVLLTRLGIVSPQFWRQQWRYALVVFLVVSAIITPDGSGVTMVFLSLPMTGLYLIGSAVAQPMRSGKWKVES